jgi:hypothetical protein
VETENSGDSAKVRAVSISSGNYSFYQEKPENRDTEILSESQDPNLPIPNEFSPLGLSRRQIGVVFVGLLLGVLIAALDNNIVSTALPSIVSDFGRLVSIYIF